jgi:hypothetical protein
MLQKLPILYGLYGFKGSILSKPYVSEAFGEGTCEVVRQHLRVRYPSGCLGVGTSSGSSVH